MKVKHGEHTLSAMSHGVTTEHMQLFAKRLKKLMGKEIKDGDLARGVPCSAPTVRRWRMGSGLPTLKSGLRVAAYFKTEPYSLFQGTPLEGLYKASLAPAVPVLRDRPVVNMTNHPIKLDGKTVQPAKSISTEAAAAAHPPAAKANGGSNGTHHPEDKVAAIKDLSIDVLLDRIDAEYAAGIKHIENAKKILEPLREKIKAQQANAIDPQALEEKVKAFARDLVGTKPTVQ